MNFKNDKINQNWKILIAFWSVVIFSLGFYLIYYYQCKKRILKIRKNIEIKLFHLKNIIIAINQEILIIYGLKIISNEILIILNQKIDFFDFSTLLYELKKHINNMPNILFNEKINILLKRLSSIQKNANYLIQYFNIYSYEFPYQYIFFKNNWNKINLIEPIIDQKI